MTAIRQEENGRDFEKESSSVSPFIQKTGVWKNKGSKEKAVNGNEEDDVVKLDLRAENL